jgi:hypothetical protein
MGCALCNPNDGNWMHTIHDIHCIGDHVSRYFKQFSLYELLTLHLLYHIINWIIDSDYSLFYKY